MKFTFGCLILFFSLHTLAGIKFKVPADQNIKSFKNTKDNHLLILRSYKNQIDSEIRRLIQGIEYETLGKAPNIRISSYQNLLAQLLIKRIFLTELENQLNPVDLDFWLRQKPRKQVFNTDAMKIDLEKEIGVHLDQALLKETIGHYFLNDLKKNLIKETLKTLAVKTYQSVGTGLLTKIITQGVSASALMSMGSKIFVSAGTSTLIAILTLPLHGYRLPPETVWTDILHKNPELIINPEWMKYAKSHDDPWYSHGYAILRRTKQMERAFNTLMAKEEAEFQSSVLWISKIQKFKQTPKEERYDPYVNRPDGTYVHKPVIWKDHPPFWAVKRS